MRNDTQQVGESKLRRLAYVRTLFRIGDDHLDRETEPNMALATLIFDNCVEMMLWLLVDAYTIEISGEKQKTHFPKLLSTVSNKMQESGVSVLSGNASDLQELHLARNAIQHHGIVPTLSAIQRYRSISELVLSKLTQESFSLDWDNISMALLIVEPVVRELYGRAEKDFDNRKYLEAALTLVAAFEFMKAKEIDRRAGSGIFMKRAFAIGMAAESKDDNVRHLAEYAQAIEGEVEILKLGIDYKCFQRYRDFVGIEPFDTIDVPITSNDADEILKVIKKKYGSTVRFEENNAGLREWLVFAFGFVIDSILHWQLVKRKGVFEFLFSKRD